VRIAVRVPATSANLGPGFDCFGLALDLCNEVTIDTEAEPGVSWEGEGADELPTDGTDMVSRAIAFTLERHSRDDSPPSASPNLSETDGATGSSEWTSLEHVHPSEPMPRFALHGVNRIPLERGLGSSSAAAVAGAAIAQAWLGRTGPIAEEPVLAMLLFSAAAELEGHPDNAAAAVYGGFTVVAEAGRFPRRLDPHPSLAPVVFIPEERLATSVARGALSPTVPREDAVFNVGQAALTVVAFTQDPTMLVFALHDRLHEDARASLMPGSAEALTELRRANVPACLSGAGPSVLAFERTGHPMPAPPDGWRAIRPGIRSTGVEVVVQD
jgi:homoserine kinase